MKIAIFGASGMIGSRILAEARARGHNIIAIVRNPQAVAPDPDVRAVAGDVTSAASVAATTAGADIAICAYSAPPDVLDGFSTSAHALLTGLPQAGVARLIVIGGAGSLEVAPGVPFVETPQFPAIYKERSMAQKTQLDIFRSQRDAALTWTFVSPSAMIAPGERTGKYRLGTDALLVDAAGESKISAEDFAIAILDEVEQPTHHNTRFTVGY